MASDRIPVCRTVGSFLAVGVTVREKPFSVVVKYAVEISFFINRVLAKVILEFRNKAFCIPLFFGYRGLIFHKAPPYSRDPKSPDR